MFTLSILLVVAAAVTVEFGQRWHRTNAWRRVARRAQLDEVRTHTHQSR